jgi:hypothetical protein
MGFVVEERWQGYVVDVADEVFRAALFSDQQNGDVETVELEKEEVNILMRSLIRPGAIFYFDIGYEIEPGGQKRRQSVVSFPMIPVVSPDAIRKAKVAAMKRFHELGWSSPQQDGGDQPETTPQI